MGELAMDAATFNAILQAVANYGALVTFFVAVGFALYKWLPPMFATMTQCFREMVAALNSSTEALKSNTAALQGNNAAFAQHAETTQTIKALWTDMQDELERIRNTCTYHPPKRPARGGVRIVSDRKVG